MSIRRLIRMTLLVAFSLLLAAGLAAQTPVGSIRTIAGPVHQSAGG